MTFRTPRQNQGQIVTVSYAYGSDGTAYRRTHDASDNTTVYERGDIDWDREPEHEDHERAPCVEEWVECEEPRE
jgi:hypothetical protein